MDLCYSSNSTTTTTTRTTQPLTTPSSPSLKDTQMQTVLDVLMWLMLSSYIACGSCCRHRSCSGAASCTSLSTRRRRRSTCARCDEPSPPTPAWFVALVCFCVHACTLFSLINLCILLFYICLPCEKFFPKIVVVFNKPAKISTIRHKSRIFLQNLSKPAKV